MTSPPSLKYVREVAKGNEDWMVLGSGSARFGMVCVPGVCLGGREWGRMGSGGGGERLRGKPGARRRGRVSGRGGGTPGRGDGNQ